MQNHTLEKKIIQALDKALARGPEHGARLRRTGKIMSFAGAFVAIYAMLVYLPGKDAGAYGHVVAIALGAYFAGFAGFFNTAGAQWPILSRFIDRAAVAAAAQEEQRQGGQGLLCPSQGSLAGAFAHGPRRHPRAWLAVHPVVSGQRADGRCIYRRTAARGSLLR